MSDRLGSPEHLAELANPTAEWEVAPVSNVPSPGDLPTIRAPQHSTFLSYEEQVELDKQQYIDQEDGSTRSDMYFQERLQFALKDSDDPVRDQYKALGALWLSDRMGVNERTIFQNFDRYVEEFTGSKVLPQTFWGLINDDFTRGFNALTLGHAGGVMMVAPGNETQMSRVIDIMNSNPDVSDQERTWLNRALGDVAEFLPMMGATMLGGLVGAKAGGLLGGKGAAAGFIIGSALEAFTITQGNLFVDIAFMNDPETNKPLYQALYESADNQILDPVTGQMVPDKSKEEAFDHLRRIAGLFSTAGGMVSALLEIPQLDILVGGKLLEDTVFKHLSDIAEKALRDSVLKNMAAQYVVRYGLNVAEEVLQENIQESVEFWTTAIAQKDIAKELEMKGFEPATIKAWTDHLAEVTSTTFNAMLFMSGPGSFVSASQKATLDKREALSDPDLEWQAGAESVFIEINDLEYEKPSEADITEANRAIDTNKEQAPIQAQELEGGEIVVAPKDQARAAAYEQRGMKQVPVEVTPWAVDPAGNVDAGTMATTNNWTQRNGEVVVGSQKTLDTLVEQDPAHFKATEAGVVHVNTETQEVTPMKTEVDVAVQESNLEEAVLSLAQNIDEMPAEIQEAVQTLATRVADAQRRGNLFDLRKSLKDDEIFGDVHLQWFAENNPEGLAAMENAIQEIENISDDLVPKRATETEFSPRENVPSLKSVENQRTRSLEASQELDSLDRVAKTPEVKAKVQALQDEIASLIPYQEDQREASARRAAERAWKIPDYVLEDYSDREWAQEEIAHRKVLRGTVGVFEEAGSFMSDQNGFEEYILSDSYWDMFHTNEEKRAFFEAIPEDAEARSDFLRDMVDRSYYKTERNISEFLDAVQTDEGILAWITKIPPADILKSHLNKTMGFAASRMGRGLDPTPEMIDSIRKELTQNVGYWQPIFFQLAAERDPQVAADWQAQKDYEYVMNLEGTRARNSIGQVTEVAQAEEAVEDKRISEELYTQLVKLREWQDKNGHITEAVAEHMDKRQYGAIKAAKTRIMNKLEPLLGDLGLNEAKAKFARMFVEDGKVNPWEAEGVASKEEAIEAVIERAKANGVGLKLQLDEGGDVINLTNIEVIDKENQQSGLGTATMSDITEVADEYGLGMRLFPVDVLGSDMTRLRNFYKRFGFVETKGKNYNPEYSSEAMYRKAAPQADTTDAGIEKKISRADAKIKSLREALKSARQEARLQEEAAVEAERQHNTQKLEAEDRKRQKQEWKQSQKYFEAVDKAKALQDKIRELRKEHRAAVKAKAAAQRLREQKIKLGHRIKRPAGKGINVRIRDKIEILQEFLSDNFTTPGRARQWEEDFIKTMNEFKDESLQELMTKHGLSPRPLNEWTIAEMKTLNDEIDGLRKEGKQYQDELDDQLREYYRKVRQETIEAWTGGEPPAIIPGGSVQDKTANKSGLIKSVAFWTWRPSRIFRWMDQWTEGQFYKYFVTDVNEKMDTVIQKTHERRVRGEQKMASLGISIKDLAVTERIGDADFTHDSMIHVWLAMKNENSARAIRKGNQISDDQIMLIDDKLTAEEKQWGEYMLLDFSENYQRLANVYELYMNEHMGREQAYFPMIRAEKSWERQDEEFWDQFKLRNEYRTSYSDRGMTIERVQNHSKRQAKINLGATHIWSEQVEKHEHWISMGMHVRGMNGIVNRWQFKDAVRGKFGLQGEKFLTKYIEDVANPTMFRATDSLSQISRRLRKNAAIAYLAYNVLTMLKQIPSIALFLRDVGPLRLIAAAGEYMAQPKKWATYINMRDPQMFARIINTELENIKRQEKGVASRAISTVGNVGMGGIKFFDSAVTHIGWLAVYQKNVNTLGEAAAVRKAQMAVLETQPSARAKDLAQLYRSGEGYNWFTMFTNQLNNIWNMSTADNIYNFKNGEYTKMAGTVVGVGISVMSMMLLGGWRPGDEDEPATKEFLKQAVNMIPIIGKGISAGLTGWNQGAVEPFPVAQEFGNAMEEVFEFDGEGLGKSIYDMALAAGVTAGLPVTGLVRRPAEAIKERDVRELAGSAFAGDE